MGVERQRDEICIRGYFLPIQTKMAYGRRKSKRWFYLYSKKWLMGV